MDNTNNFAALKAATLGASQIQSPGSTLGASMAPEIALLHQSSFQVPQATVSAGASANLAQQQVAEQKQAAADAAQRAKDLADPSKYRQIPKEDGGFTFIDPTGKEISAHDFALAVGTTPSKVLADSTNPIDIGYNQDAKNLQTYIQAKLNAKNDTNDDALAKKIESQVKEQQGVDLGSLKIEDVINRFKQAYPTVYGTTNTGVRAGSTYFPSIDPASLDSGGSIGG